MFCGDLQTFASFPLNDGTVVLDLTVSVHGKTWAFSVFLG